MLGDERWDGWTGGNSFALGNLLSPSREQSERLISDWFPFLIPTNTAGSLLVEMVATATVGHVLLACVGALRVDACLPNGARGTDT